jgi:hypothetical protein
MDIYLKLPTPDYDVVIDQLPRGGGLTYDRNGQEVKIFSNGIVLAPTYIETFYGTIVIHLIYRPNIQFDGQAYFTYKMTNNFGQ